MADFPHVRKSKELGARQLAEYRQRYEPLLGLAYSRALNENQDLVQQLGERGMAGLMGGMEPASVEALSGPQRQQVLASALMKVRGGTRGAKRSQMTGDLLNVLGSGMERRSMARSALQNLYGLRENQLGFDDWYRDQKKQMRGSTLMGLFNLGKSVFGG